MREPPERAMAVIPSEDSFTALDVNTPITVITVGSAMTVMTNLDVDLTFAIEG